MTTGVVIYLVGLFISAVFVFFLENDQRYWDETTMGLFMACIMWPVALPILLIVTCAYFVGRGIRKLLSAE